MGPFSYTDYSGWAEASEVAVDALANSAESETDPLSFTLFEHDAYPYAIVDMSPHVAKEFLCLRMELNGTYTVNEIFQIIRTHAMAAVVPDLE